MYRPAIGFKGKRIYIGLYGSFGRNGGHGKLSGWMKSIIKVLDQKATYVIPKEKRP
jgi:hypothetical protein